jgi:hypothetical protein
VFVVTKGIHKSLATQGTANITPAEVGAEVLRKYWLTDFCESLLAGSYVCWILKGEDIEAKTALLEEILDTCNDPGVFVSIAEVVTQDDTSENFIHEDLVSKLLLILADVGKFHGVRGQALMVCVGLVIKSDALLRSLRAIFFTIDLNDDG